MFSKLIRSRNITVRSWAFSHETEKKKFLQIKKEPEAIKVYPLQYPNLQSNDNAPIISRERPTRNLTPKFDIPLNQFAPQDDAVLREIYKNKWKSPENAFFLSIGLLGPVNAGKSELLGKLAHRVSAVSPKAATTD